MDTTHLKFFTRHSMNQMFERCGLKVLDQEGMGDLSNKFGKFGFKLDQLFPTFFASQFMSVVSKKKF